MKESREAIGIIPAKNNIAMPPSRPILSPMRAVTPQENESMDTVVHHHHCANGAMAEVEIT